MKVLGQQSIVHYNAKKRESYVCHQILLRWCQEKYFEERVNLFEPPSPLADILVTCSNKINSFLWSSVFTSYFTDDFFPLYRESHFFPPFLHNLSSLGRISESHIIWPKSLYLVRQVLSRWHWLSMLQHSECVINPGADPRLPSSLWKSMTI